jgi:hypothetical protein
MASCSRVSYQFWRQHSCSLRYPKRTSRGSRGPDPRLRSGASSASHGTFSRGRSGLGEVGAGSRRRPASLVRLFRIAFPIRVRVVSHPSLGESGASPVKGGFERRAAWMPLIETGPSPDASGAGTLQNTPACTKFRKPTSGSAELRGSADRRTALRIPTVDPTPECACRRIVLRKAP